MNEKTILAGTMMVVSFLFFLNAIISTYETVKYPDYVSAATTSSIAVTAKVTDSISCEADISSTGFGTFVENTITNATSNASTTMSCANVGGGCTFYVGDDGNNTNGGLATSSPAYLIPSPNAAFSASTTLTTSAEGYGLQATTTAAGSGDTFDLGLRYTWEDGNDVAGLSVSSSQQTVVSTNATSSGREALITHKAVVTSETQAGNYVDNIYYECAVTP